MSAAERFGRCWRDSPRFEVFVERVSCSRELRPQEWREVAQFLFDKSRELEIAVRRHECIILERHDATEKRRVFDSPARPRFGRDTIEGALIHAISPGSSPGRPSPSLLMDSPVSTSQSRPSEPRMPLAALTSWPSPGQSLPFAEDKAALPAAAEARLARMSSHLSESSDQPDNPPLLHECFPLGRASLGSPAQDTSSAVSPPVTPKPSSEGRVMCAASVAQPRASRAVSEGGAGPTRLARHDSATCLKQPGPPSGTPGFAVLRVQPSTTGGPPPPTTTQRQAPGATTPTSARRDLGGMSPRTPVASPLLAAPATAAAVPGACHWLTQVPPSAHPAPLGAATRLSRGPVPGPRLMMPMVRVQPGVR